MEKNTCVISSYIDAPPADVAAFLGDGMNLNRYTLFSRMHRQIDEQTWFGSASGYQNGLYYHVRRRELAGLHVVEWHCGADYGVYHHVYPMLAFAADYFGSREQGTYYHWVSFVDPDRSTKMIEEGIHAVHNAETHSLKAILESRRGVRAAARGDLDVRSHTIYVDAPIDMAVEYFADVANAAEWGYLLRQDGEGFVDEYANRFDLRVMLRDFGPYKLVEHDSHYDGQVIRAPILLVPCTYAFGRSDASGLIMHRITAWPRPIGKGSSDDYVAEAINAKRILEARAGNLASFARGCSYLGGAK